jgi:CRISPR system Cascade subunit CasA
MNVAFDPWIPVLDATGERTVISLHRALTRGERFADLAVRPHERVALMRLLLCVAHAALNGPRDYEEWLEIPKSLAPAVDAYLTEWRDSFELFHPEKPWLQVAAIVKKKGQPVTDADWTPATKLEFAFASGNTSTLFDHFGESEARIMDLPAVILAMVAFQCFSLGGTSSQVFWGGVQSVKYTKDAPCAPASMVHAFLRGPDLLTVIHLNLVTLEDMKLRDDGLSFGRPIWEKVPQGWSDKENVHNAASTHLGRLAPMTRLIKLHPSGRKMLLGEGLAYPTFADGFSPEPSATIVVREKQGRQERMLLSFRPGKAVWRELGAIVVKRNAQGTGGPLALNFIPDDQPCDILVAALARDKASILDAAESVFHVPAQLRFTEGNAVYEFEVQRAENMARRLGWAVETYRREVDHGWEGRLKIAGPAKGQLKARLHATGTNHFWTAVESSLSLLMAHIAALGTDQATATLEAWRKMLFASACAAYRVACGQETPRQIRAFAKGWMQLTFTRDTPDNSTQDLTEDAT